MIHPRLLTGVLSLVVLNTAFATNGMDMEGYGPIATAQGGASQAQDNGAAAFANNPATIGLIPREGALLNLAVGVLGPSVSAQMPSTADADSDADMFLMPGFGLLVPRGRLTWGLCMFAQGGMGTEYGANSFMAAGTGKGVMSQVGVGRFGLPLSYQMNDRFILGGSADLVWASMDLQMAMSGAQFGDFVAGMGGTQAFGSASGSMVEGLLGAVSAQMLNPMGPVNTARFDFADDSDFTGEASCMGFAAKLGGVYKLNDQWTLGASLHTPTFLGDLSADEATVTMSANYDDAILGGTWNPMGGTGSPAGTYTAVEVPVSGEIKVKDFQWPMQIGVGAAYKVNQKLSLAADVRQIMWSQVMEKFQMSFTADGTQANPLAAGFAATSMDMEMLQEWDDQTVIALGAAYMLTETLTLRAGGNFAANPVPDSYLNALFPAIVENHFTLGCGYQITSADAVDFSLTLAPESEADAGSGVTSTHAQTNFQLMYSHRF